MDELHDEIGLPGFGLANSSVKLVTNGELIHRDFFLEDARQDDPDLPLPTSEIRILILPRGCSLLLPTATHQNNHLPSEQVRIKQRAA